MITSGENNKEGEEINLAQIMQAYFELTLHISS